MRWSFPLKQCRCCSIAFFQCIGPLPCCWLDSVVAWGASGPGLSSSTVAVQGISLLLRGLPPPPPLHLCCQRCLCRRIENKCRQNQFPGPSCSRIVQMCLCWYRKELVQGQKRMAGARTIRNLFSISLWLILPQSICEIIDLALPCIPNMLSLLGSS